MVKTTFMPHRKRAPQHLGRVLVLGLGKSGRAAAEYCLALLGTRVTSLAIAAGERCAASEAFAQRAGERGAFVAFGDDALSTLSSEYSLATFDLCIPSPGIPPFSPLYTAAYACSEEVVSEVEFAWRESASSSKWVAVTGTNGKTTVAACTAHVLQAAGFRAAAVGNIGDTCIEAVALGATEVYVAEVSSYQLASTVHFAPQVAILLNITPDHLQWHSGFEAYCAAKFKVLENLHTTSHALAILDATNEVVRGEVRRLRALSEEGCKVSYVPLGGAAGLSVDMRTCCASDNAAFLNDKNQLVVALDQQEYTLLDARELRIAGQHNVSNALAATTAALALGASAETVAQGLRTFSPLEHRIEPCGSVGGVACINDSKATNVDATLTALAAFPQAGMVALLGGYDKGTDLSALVHAVHQHARIAVCFGAAGPRFAQAFAEACDQAPESFDVVQAAHLEDALDRALEQAQAGEVVLLSPACASFDEFASFEERGSAFKALVSQRAARAGA